MNDPQKTEPAVVRLEHAMRRSVVKSDKPAIRKYTVNRLGRAVNAARRIIYSTEELIAKVEHCQRHIGQWKSEKVHEEMTLETHKELMQDAANLRTELRDLFSLLAIRGKGVK